MLTRGLGGLLLVMAAQATPAAEQFLMNIPGINGDVTTKGYVNWISVTSFSEGISGSQGSATGLGAGRLTCQAMHIVKPLDVTSPALMAAVATGHHYSTIELVALSTSDGGQGEFLRLTLQNVLIASVTFAGDSSTSARVETLTLDPERIEVTYTPQLADGRPGTPVTSQVNCSNLRF
jgi:type VI secretion system secreted protein Hcp